VSKQELIAQVTELQQKLARKTVDHTRVANRLNVLTEESEALRNKNEQQSEAMKSMQKKMNDSPSSRQNRSPLRDSHGHHSRSSLLPVPAKLDSTRSASITSITTSVAESEASDTPKQTKSSPTAQTISATTGKTVEVDALKHSLAHSHRTIAQLRAMLHMERTEKNETKKLLSESQETIEKMRRNRHAWNDEEPSVQLNTPKIKMVPSKRRGAARYASGLIRGSEVDHHCELEPSHAEENIQNMDESCDEIGKSSHKFLRLVASSFYYKRRSLLIKTYIDDMQPHEDQCSPTLATSENQSIKPCKMRSLGEELQLAIFSVEPIITDSRKGEETEGEGKDQGQDSFTVSEGGQLRSQVAYHAKRTSPKRRNIDSSKECSLRRSPKLRDLTNNPAPHVAGIMTEIPTPKPTMSESTVRTLQETIVMRPSVSEPRVPVLIQTHLPSTTNIGEINTKKDEENQMISSSIYTQFDADTKLDVSDSPNSQKRNSRLLRKSNESQRSTSSAISLHWRSSIAGDMAFSRSDNSTGGLTLLTQTMIGDWMWKYTRKTVGNGYSEKPHKRFCWIHPYTRTLYWSTVEPGIGEAESKAKSGM
jgi:Meiotic cell cortex C-terminal pleckstrin homology